MWREFKFWPLESINIYCGKQTRIFRMNVWFRKFASCLAHVLLNPRQIFIDPEQKSVVLILWLNRFFCTLCKPPGNRLERIQLQSSSPQPLQNPRQGSWNSGWCWFQSHDLKTWFTLRRGLRQSLHCRCPWSPPPRTTWSLRSSLGSLAGRPARTAVVSPFAPEPACSWGIQWSLKNPAARP